MIRGVLHYDATSCMKDYFKDSLEAKRGPGRRGARPEEGRVKGRLLGLEKSQLQNKTVLYLQRKTHSSFCLGPEKEICSHRISEKLVLFLYLPFTFPLTPPQLKYSCINMHPKTRCHPTIPNSLYLQFHSLWVLPPHVK